MTDQQASQLPPPPPGYTLDPSPAPQSTATTLPPPPAGYTLDAPPTDGRSDFDTSSLGPNFQPDYSIDVYSTPLPSGPTPYPGDPKGPSIPMYNYPPGSTQLQPMTVQGLDKPLTTAEKVAMYPLDYMAGGMQQTGQGLAGLQHPQSFDQVAGATSDLIRGGMTIATPFFAPEMIAAPKAALTGLATFGAAQQGIEWTAKHLGLSPGVAKLAGDIGGLFGGWRAHQWLSDMARIPDTRITNEINQKIDAHLAAAQDPTLTPEQRAASKAAVDALLTALRGEEGWKLPALFPNPNEMERQAYKYYRGLGGPPNAGMASGSPIVRGSTWLSGMTPAGGYMDVRAKAQTVEALRTRAAGLLAEAAPPEGPAREFYSQVEDAINKSTPVNVPLRVDKDGSQISGDVKAPVDLRDLKYDMDPLWQKLQFLPMKDQSVSHAFSALKVLNNADDHISAPMAEVALSQFKQALIKREPGGIEGALTKTVIPKLQAAIDSAVKEYAGDDALTNLQAGRRAAAKEFGADWLSDQFKLAQQEGGFAHGKRLWNNWTTLTESAKRTMFTPDKVDELNRFFHALRMIEDNPNPSGTALAGAIGAQAGWAMHGGVMEPWFYLGQLAGGGFAKLLRSDLGVKLLTEGITIPRTTARGRFVEQQLKDILSQGQRRPAGGGPPEEPPPPPPPGGGGGPPANPPAAPAGSKGSAPGGIKGALKNIWEDEEGSLKIGGRNQPDRLKPQDVLDKWGSVQPGTVIDTPDGPATVVHTRFDGDYPTIGLKYTTGPYAKYNVIDHGKSSFEEWAGHPPKPFRAVPGSLSERYGITSNPLSEPPEGPGTEVSRFVAGPKTLGPEAWIGQKFDYGPSRGKVMGISGDKARIAWDSGATSWMDLSTVKKALSTDTTRGDLIEAPETPTTGQKIKDLAKRFLAEEEGSLTLRNLRKADRAAGSEQSTRVPRAVKSTEDPLSNILTTGLESWSRDPEMMRKNVTAMLDYPNFHDLRPQVKNGSLSIPDAAERMIGRIQDNLQWLHDSMPENFRDRARLWYDGAHKIARKWAGDYGATPEQVAGSMAVTSPGTDWFVNAERARRLLEFWQDRGSKTWDPRMETTWRDKVSKAVPEQARGQIYKLIKGKSFNQVANDPDIAPIWFRLYDEAVNPREYPTLTPEGKAGDLARIGSGDPRQFSWSDFGQIGKVLSILEDGSKENIHKNLGQEHKVRNFYNNIINPDSPREHTTIDTHAVAAGLMRPLSQMSTEVGHNFGGPGSSSSSISGESGTYALHKEAYRRAAAANGLLPREMQSITWEAIRSMFSPQFKRNPANVEYVNSLWRDVSSGKITADAARQRALQYGGGFDRPAWFKGRWNPATPKAAGPSSKPR